jgi:hypothetical protein
MELWIVGILIQASWIFLIGFGAAYFIWAAIDFYRRARRNGHAL